MSFVLIPLVIICFEFQFKSFIHPRKVRHRCYYTVQQFIYLSKVILIKTDKNTFDPNDKNYFDENFNNNNKIIFDPS